MTLSSEVFEDGKNYTVTVISYNYSVMSAAFTYTKPEEPEEPEEPELIPAEEVSYQIIKGADSVWTKGSSEGLLIASDAPFEKFDSVLIDGEEADAANYEAVSGSTEVTLKAAYLETLEDKEHTIEIKSTDGSASTRFTVKQASKKDGGKDSSGKSDDAGDKNSSKSDSTGKKSGSKSDSTGNKNSKSSGTVKTGDSSPVALWLALFVLAGAAVIHLMKKRIIGK